MVLTSRRSFLNQVETLSLFSLMVAISWDTCSGVIARGSGGLTEGQAFLSSVSADLSPWWASGCSWLICSEILSNLFHPNENRYQRKIQREPYAEIKDTVKQWWIAKVLARLATQISWLVPISRSLVSVMRAKSLLRIIAILLLLFISIGDRILPHPLGDASRNSRTQINEFLLSLFPKKELKNPHRRTEEIIRQVEWGR